MINDNIIDEGKLLSTPELSDDIHIWADYCEICCLISKEQELSDEEIYRILSSSKDLSPNDNGSHKKTNQDRAIGVIRDALSHIALRDSLLDVKYPFSFNSDKTTLKVKGEYSYEQLIYIVLLCASNLKYIKTAIRPLLTSGFECISLHTMREILPTATVKLFGSSNVDNSLSKGDMYSATKLKDRIVELSKDISQIPIEQNLTDLKEQNTGDGGLDIIGFIDLKDGRSSHPLFFAQCACSKEAWADKQKSTFRDEWSKYLIITDTSVHNFILVPFMYMDNEKKWADRLQLTRNVMIDRLRIMRVISYKTPFTIKALDIIKQDLEVSV